MLDRPSLPVYNSSLTLTDRESPKYTLTKGCCQKRNCEQRMAPRGLSSMTKPPLLVPTVACPRGLSGCCRHEREKNCNPPQPRNRWSLVDPPRQKTRQKKTQKKLPHGTKRGPLIAIQTKQQQQQQQQQKRRKNLKRVSLNHQSVRPVLDGEVHEATTLHREIPRDPAWCVL